MRSLSVDRALVEFVEKYMTNHKLNRMKAGKPTTIISAFREGLFLWAEREGVLDELMAFLKQP